MSTSITVYPGMEIENFRVSESSVRNKLATYTLKYGPIRIVRALYQNDEGYFRCYDNYRAEMPDGKRVGSTWIEPEVLKLEVQSAMKLLRALRASTKANDVPVATSTIGEIIHSREAVE